MTICEEFEAVLEEMREHNGFMGRYDCKPWADRLSVTFSQAVEEATRERIAGMQREPVAHALICDGAAMAIHFAYSNFKLPNPEEWTPLYAAPLNAQALIDAATERVALALQMQRSPILAENIRTEFLGKPLNDSKGG